MDDCVVRTKFGTKELFDSLRPGQLEPNLSRGFKLEVEGQKAAAEGF